MSDEKRALTRHSPPPSEADYEAILAAVMETGRGRWFLHEFAQRNRHAETRGVLSAIERLEGMLRSQGGAPALPHPAAGQIATAIARAQEMVAASSTGGEAHAFDNVAQALETAQVRMRGVYTRLRDAALALRAEGGHSRICNELDRQVRDLEAGCAQIEDASGDIRILIALLKDIESLAAETAPQAGASAASEPVPEALVVTQVAVPPQPQNDPVETGLMVSDTVSLEELEACEAEFAQSEPESPGEQKPAVAELVTVHVVAAETTEAAAPRAGHPEPVADAANVAETEAPAAVSPPTIQADAFISDPAEFLLEPLPQEDSQDIATGLDVSVAAREIEAEKPLAPLRLDSFDPLAPLRALSDEEKIAIFS